MSHVTHFEIYGEHPENLVQFYGTLLGWQLEKVAGVDYWRVQTGFTEANGLHGGLTFRPNPELRSWLLYVNVPVLDDVLARLKELGGKVLRPKAAVPKTAWYALVADPQGNSFGVWQHDPTAFPPPEPD
jgi:hypothetical protein